jgi:hypothetical protein
LRKDLADTEQVITHVVAAADLFESRNLAPREWLGGAIGSGGRDAFLGEVKTLQPNSEDRIEAIRRAERARAREMELRRENEFQVELGEVVNEGKLKNLGEGAQRIEREREEKERRMRQEIWEREKLKGMQQQDTQSVASELVISSDDSDRALKRTVSEGRAAVTSAVGDDSVTRSISHSSGLSRMKRISNSRFSGEAKRTSSPGNVDGVEETEEGETVDNGVGGDS